MSIRFKAEMRKINGHRFARFKLHDDIDTDSQEEALIASALTECDITFSDNTGVFKNLAETADGNSVLRIGGIDVPVVSIKAFTTALTDKGFEVT